MGDSSNSFRAYRVLQWLLRLATQVFFRRIEVVGRENLPAEGGVIFCGNHPNSLLDPILITASCGRIVHFAAKDVLFRSRLLKVFLRIMGAVPVKRRKDHGDGPLDNDSMFEAMYQALGSGRSIGIFPEGISHLGTELAPLKTGAARIALGTARSHPEVPIYLVPTGLCYFRRHKFRSSVLVQFGEPIRITDAWVARAADDERKAVGELTDAIDDGMRALTINAKDWRTLWVLDGVRRLYRPHVSLEDKAYLARRFNVAYPEVAHRPDVQALFKRVEAYLGRMSAVGLDDSALQREISIREAVARVIGHVALVVFFTPLFLAGATVNFPLGIALKLLGNTVAPRPDVVATTKFMLGVFLTLAVYGGVSALVGWNSGVWAGVSMFFTLIVSGMAMVWVIARIDALRHLFQTGYRIARIRQEVEELRAERAQLEEEVAAIVDKYRPGLEEVLP